MVEQGMAAMQTQLNQMETMQAQLNQIMAMLRQSETGNGGNRHNSSINEANNQETSSRSFRIAPKVQFPQFDGSEVTSWLLKCEQYFTLCKVDDNQRVNMACLNMIGEAGVWAIHYLAVNKNASWIDFVMALPSRFRVDSINVGNVATEIGGMMLQESCDSGEFFGAVSEISKEYFIEASQGNQFSEIDGFDRNPSTMEHQGLFGVSETSEIGGMLQQESFDDKISPGISPPLSEISQEITANMTDGLQGNLGDEIAEIAEEIGESRLKLAVEALSNPMFDLGKSGRISLDEKVLKIAMVGNQNSVAFSQEIPPVSSEFSQEIPIGEDSTGSPNSIHEVVPRSLQIRIAEYLRIKSSFDVDFCSRMLRSVETRWIFDPGGKTEVAGTWNAN